MFKMFLFEEDPLVRVDIVGLIEGCFPDVSLHIAESLSVLSQDLYAAKEGSVVLMSATTQQVKEFFADFKPLEKMAFVIFGDEDNKRVLPEEFSIVTVPKPFTNDTLSEGIRNATSFLHSSR